jgi:hypothetical protein
VAFKDSFYVHRLLQATAYSKNGHGSTGGNGVREGAFPDRSTLSSITRDMVWAYILVFQNFHWILVIARLSKESETPSSMVVWYSLRQDPAPPTYTKVFNAITADL